MLFSIYRLLFIKYFLHNTLVICVKVWNTKEERQLLVEWVVFFSGLVFLGEQVLILKSKIFFSELFIKKKIMCNEKEQI